MKGLLIKDFKLLKGQKNFFMTITAISIIMIIVSPGIVVQLSRQKSKLFIMN